MNTINLVDNYTLTIPHSDSSFLRTITKRMGWKMEKVKEKKCALDLALEEVERGELYTFNSVEEVMADLLT